MIEFGRLAVLAAAWMVAGTVAPLPPDRPSKAQAEALITVLDTTLLASRSATATLADWCAAHHLAVDPKIRAVRDRGADVAPTAEQRVRLGIGPGEPVVYRRVALVCGTTVLSQAENWFVPARLDPAMVRALAETDTPFGTVIAPLQPQRRTVSDERLWHPLDRGARRCVAVPQTLLRHRALVLTPVGTPLAEVVETYQRDLLGFAVPWARRATRHCGRGADTPRLHP